MKRLIGWLMMLLCSFSAKAQYDAAFTNYWTLQSYFNPAYSGLSKQIDVKAAYSMQLVGFENAPSTMYVGVDMPLFFIGPRHGVGVAFMNDKIGLFSNKKISLQYAYHQPLWGGRLSGGARVALLNETFDGSKVDIEDSGDPAFATNQASGNSIDLDFGLRWTYKDTWNFGFSGMHLLSPTIKLGDDKMHEVKVKPLLYAMGGYNVHFRQPQYVLYTNAILRTDMVGWRGDVTARLGYTSEKLKFYGGVSYSPTISVGALFGFTFHGVEIGYSYEFYTGGIGALNGTHEIVLGYQTDINLFKKGRNKHQSVRIL